MAASEAFRTHLLELMAPLGGLRTRRMFGGVAIYREDLLFALVAGDRLSFQVDEDSRGWFEARNLAPFRHATRRGPRLLRSCFEAPCETLEEREEMLRWAERAVAAARRWRMRKAAGP